jgi:16S rRNA (guanine527-N7)-methyltransferase
MNLTSIDAADAVALHVLDSLTALRALQAAPMGPFADLGSGPGYPGIPLSIVSGRAVALVESVKKKASFLERVIGDLRLEATVHPIRAEELALEMPGRFSAVTARALSSLPALVELATPLLAPGGVLICMKARLDDEELRRGDLAGALCGLQRESIDRVSVPGIDVERTIVTYRRSSLSRVRLPRRPGMAQRQPLA